MGACGADVSFSTGETRPMAEVGETAYRELAFRANGASHDEDDARPRPRLVTTAPSAGASTRLHEPDAHELRISFRELTLIHKCLQAVKALGALPPQDELLNDTIQLVDQALDRAV